MACPANGGACRFLTKTPENERWPMPSARAVILCYVSDRDGTPNLWKRPNSGGDAVQITRFREGNVFFPSLSRDGDRIVFEHDFRLWSVDTHGGAPHALSIMAPTDLKNNPIRRETFAT